MKVLVQMHCIISGAQWQKYNRLIQMLLLLLSCCKYIINLSNVFRHSQKKRKSKFVLSDINLDRSTYTKQTSCYSSWDRMTWALLPIFVQFTQLLFTVLYIHCIDTGYVAPGRFKTHPLTTVHGSSCILRGALRGKIAKVQTLSPIIRF